MIRRPGLGETKRKRSQDLDRVQPLPRPPELTGRPRAVRTSLIAFFFFSLHGFVYLRITTIYY
jgi:hypothetical protein